MKKRLKVVLFACIAILLCMTLITAGTYALFTDSATVNNHLEAGSLDITLVRTNLKKTVLDETTGYLKELDEDKTVVDFSKANSENLFGLQDGEKTVPGCKYIADMKISNDSSVAFGYWVEIKCLDGSSIDLSKQLKVTVVLNENDQKESNVYDGLKVGSESKFIGVLEKNEKAETFSIIVEFIDSDNNNLSMDKNAYFDVVVYAVQVTEEK